VEIAAAHVPLTPAAPPLPSLLIGTSLIRNVDPSKLQNCEVIAKGGALIQDLHKTLAVLPENKKYSEITVIGGSIDIESKTADDIATDYQALIVSASMRTEKVSICSVLPRTDKQLPEITNKVNGEQRKICQDEGHTFLDIDDSFHLRNGKINSACLLPDGLHLTKYGVDSLMQGCNVQRKPGIESTFTESRYKKEKENTGEKEKHHFKGHESPFSNFFPVRGLRVDGIPFATTEAAYVHQKALFHSDRHTAEAVKRSQTSIHAKRLGDKIRTSPEWQMKKVDVMDNIIRTKLNTCNAVWRALKESGSEELIENTSNAFWGRGHDNKGQNTLERLWMLYRSKMTSTNTRNTSNISRTWATHSNQPRCYRCGDPGHLLEQCRQREEIACWNCGAHGHKSKHCRNFAPRSNGHLQ